MGTLGEKGARKRSALRELGPVSVRGKDLPFRIFAAASPAS